MSDRPRDREPDLDRLADDLAATLEDLRTEIEERRRPRAPRGPLGLPRPPTPRELLRFADEFAIPTIIAVLEANIRALEALQAALRLGRAGAEADERGREIQGQVEETSRRTLSQLDDALADLQDALAGRPENEEARTLLDDARDLRREIDERLAASTDTDRSPETDHDGADDRGTKTGAWDDDPEDATADPGPPDEADRPEEGVTIDVDAELDSIRDEVDGDDADGNSRTGGNGTDDGADGDNGNDRDDGDGRAADANDDDS